MPPSPKTQKKLREARFFFDKISSHEKDFHYDSEEFDFYVSAFLCAARSVTFFLHAENKAWYDNHFNDFMASLPADDRDLLAFMNEQRVAEVHRLGSDIQSVVNMVPLSELSLRKTPTFKVEWSGPPGTPPPQIGRETHFFKDGATTQEVVASSKHYLE